MLHKLTVFFPDAQGYLNEERPYYYVADSDTLGESFKSFGTLGLNRDQVYTYSITNSFGHNYNEAEVVIIDNGPVTIRPAGLKELTSIKWAGHLGLSYTERIWLNKCLTAASSGLVWQNDQDCDQTAKEPDEFNPELSLCTSTQNQERGDKPNMFDNLFRNFKFGPVGNEIKMSALGMAIRGKDNSYSAYDATKNDFVDATELILEGLDDFIYTIPVAVSEVKPGDYIYHNGTPVRVVAWLGNNTISTQNISTHEVVNVIPVRNIFGFNFFSKVVNFAEGMFTNANANNPFGAILPLMLMQKTQDRDNNHNSDMKNMLPLMMMMGNGTNGFGGAFTNNPMLLMMMMGDSDTNKMLPMMMMMQGGNLGNMFGNAPATVTA